MNNLKIGVLGPQGTFSDAAASAYLKKANALGKKVFFATLPGVFDALEGGKVGLAVVPVENALGGTVSITVDRLFASNFKISGEIVLPVSHALCVMESAQGGIKKIFGHPQAFEQCRAFLKKNFPQARLVPSQSNVQALNDLLKSGDETAAALGPVEQAKAMGLKVIARQAEDSKHNVTRFLVVGKKQAPKTGFDRTSAVLLPFANRDGVLHGILGVFARHGINLSKIESRPSRTKLGVYLFHVDFEGHQKDARVKAALVGLKKLAKVKILGSYPRAY